jgi:hypothetical protein
MLAHICRPKTGLSMLLGVGGSIVLAVMLALPLDAAPQKAKGRRTSPSGQTAAGVNKDEVSSTSSAPEAEPATIDVLQGLQTGRLSATAKGTGDGRMTLLLTNRTSKKLRVVLPPGLIASGATGQFGGMGMGMMGGMGGGMGMMGGGMGGMGGGMGGMGGGMGGMGGGMMGGRMGMMGMGGGTMPASMGMMMLGRLVMNLIGDRDSWDMSSLMIGMMGGMGMMGGGMGMGGMGMGGMGMGGMGGGFRSVPPTGPLETTLQPHQVRRLPTAVVSLNGPDANARPAAPAKDEDLQISAIEQWTDDARTRTALKRLAEAKAPQTVAQMVLWYVTAGADWDDVGRLSQGWGNANEIALARRFVAELEKPEPTSPGHDPGSLYWNIQAEGDATTALVDGLRALWAKYPVLGLTAREGIPARPDGPALACRMEVRDSLLDVKLLASHPSGSDWVTRGGFRINLPPAKPCPEDAAAETPTLSSDQVKEREAIRLGDEVAAGLLERLVRLRLAHGPKVKGKEAFRIKIVNDSPLILNGLALVGLERRGDQPPSVLLGLSLPPLKSFTVPATAELVERLKLNDGVRVLAADLSGL